MSGRDYQRQKVYDAEQASDRRLDAGRIGYNLDEAQDILDLLSAEFTVPRVTIRQHRGIKRWGGLYITGEDRIATPRNWTTASTLLHEFAHHLHDYTERGGADHGGRFTEAHLRVVEAWAGPEAAAYLREQYEARNVDIGIEAEEARQRRRAASQPDTGDRRTRYTIRATDGRAFWWATRYHGGPVVVSRETDYYEALTWAREATARKHAEDIIRKWQSGDDDVRFWRKPTEVAVMKVTEEYWNGWEVGQVDELVDEWTI